MAPVPSRKGIMLQERTALQPTGDNRRRVDRGRGRLRFSLPRELIVSGLIPGALIVNGLGVVEYATTLLRGSSSGFTASLALSMALAADV